MKSLSYTLASCSLLGIPLFAVDYERTAPQVPNYFQEQEEKNMSVTEKTPIKENELLVDKLSTLALESLLYYREKSTIPETEGTYILGLELSDKEQNKLQLMLEEQFLNKPIMTETLQKIKQTILQFYGELDRPLVYIEYPEQDISSGRLIIVITEAILGKITYQGNKHFSKESYARAMRSKVGSPIETKKLMSDLWWINRNPFRYASANLAPGETEGTTDIDLVIKDKLPFRVYSGVDNTGFPTTGKVRFFGGLNYANLFNKGHMIAYQFTSSIDFKKFLSSSGFYSIPLPWRHTLNFFGGYSTVKTDVGTVPGYDFHMLNTGRSAQASMRYNAPYTFNMISTHTIRGGADFKSLNNTLDLGGDTVSTQTVQLLQFTMGYELDYKGSKASHCFGIDVYGAPCQMLPDMSKQRFEELRRGSKPNYIYALANYKAMYFLPKDFEIHTRLQGQLASTHLLQTEQFGLGGLYTVRGYQERVVNADNAFLLNFDAYLPSVYLLKKKQGKLRFSTFVDFGIGGSPSSSYVEPTPVSYLLGVGPGLTFTVGDWLSFQGYFGYQALKIGKEGDGERFHVNFTGSISF